MSITFVYELQQPTSMIKDYSTNTNYVESKSKEGYIIKCRGVTHV